MSGTTESLRRKIEGAQDLNGVVRSMKALAASSIGQYERAVESLDLYYRTVELGLAACFRVADPREYPAVSVQNEGTPVGAVIFGSDQGLVGRFNETLVEFAMHELKEMGGKTVRIWAVGERIQTLLTGASPVPAGLLPVPISVYGITALVGQILVEIEGARERGEIARVYLFHNRIKSGAVFEPVMRGLLPLDSAWRKSLAGLPWPTKNLPEVIETGQPALSAFVSGYLFVLLFQACAESLASENASRLAAMQRAEKNIEEVLENLRRTFHRIRQESIDEELFDVISGYEALSGSIGKASTLVLSTSASKSDCEASQR
jgi:F-type H+-transporting ATPase subunit gamma